MTEGPVRTARCTNVVELPDFAAAPCPGVLSFASGDNQARCDTCSGWCGAGVADYISDLQARLLRVIRGKDYRTVTFTNLDGVPPGSSGYLSPTWAHAERLADGS